MQSEKQTEEVNQMETLLIVAAVACGIIGFLGAVIPVLPGTILSYIGLLCAYFTSDADISNQKLIIWGIIAALAVILDYILPGYMSKKFGGTKKGVTGATVGVLLGMFFGPAGIIFGPFIGAFVGEMMNDHKSTDKALKVAIGSLLSFFMGTGLKLIVGGFILYYIIVAVI